STPSRSCTPCSATTTPVSPRSGSRARSDERVTRDATATREKLLRAAEHLFARRGLDVPIREIHAFAGQRNASAIQYHFGGKQELLDALVERYAPSPDAMAAIRADLASRQHDPRSFVDAFVRRQCEHL